METLSGGKFHVPHFTGKAKVDSIVKAAGFVSHTFVIAPFYFQNLAGAFGPQKLPDGAFGWAIPLVPDVRCVRMGDICELGDIATGAFLHADQVGNGEYLPLVGDILSFNEIVETLNQRTNCQPNKSQRSFSPLSFPAPPRLRRCSVISKLIRI